MKLAKILLIIFFFSYIFSFTFTSSSDLLQDLSRHLKVGETIIKLKEVPKTNFFSYTNPGFPFINHHWLSEVIFYLFSKFLGLNSLIIIKTIIVLFSVAIVIKIAIKKSGVFQAITAGLILSPLLLERNDIRPEIFGYLFFSCILYLFLIYPKSKKLLYGLSLAMLLWVNMHLTFVFGIYLIFLLMIKIYLLTKDYSSVVVCFLSFAVLIFNPNGLSGALYPFNIFRNYGYSIVENQNLFYLSRMTFNPLIKYFFAISPLIIIFSFALIIINQLTAVFAFLTFFVLTIFQFRHLPFFVLAAIPAMAIALDQIMRFVIHKWPATNGLKLYFLIILLIILFFGSVIFISNKYYLIFDRHKSFGFGFNEVNKEVIDFINKKNLPKNIFNNFDIGGYLIYKLYPNYKVFIDNRPEAYPDYFIENTYKELQVNQSTQDIVFNKYKIRTVFFSHTDQTQWGEIFMGRLLRDNNWRLVYLDSELFIAVKDKKFTDIRQAKKIFSNLINAENNYLKLLKLSRFFLIIGDEKMAGNAYLKARELNPDSCSIIKTEFGNFSANSQFYLYKSRELKNNHWYCF